MAQGPYAPSARNLRDKARLESWKEIAAYLGRGVRTVQRWEKSDGLPVHRLYHAKAGTVYAFPHELDEWWNSRRDNLIEMPGSAEAVEEPAQEPTQDPDPVGISAVARGRPYIIAAGLVVLIFLTAGWLIFAKGSSPVTSIQGRPFTTWPGYEVTP